VIDFDFLKSKHTGDILINNSGGPDCAIVFYGVAKYIKDNNLPIKIYHTSVDTTEKFFYIKHAKMVIEFVEKELGVSCEKHYTKDNIPAIMENDLPVGYAEAQKELIQSVVRENKNINYLMAGGSNMLARRFLDEAHAKGEWLRLKYSPDLNRLMKEDGGVDNKPMLKEQGPRPFFAFHPFINHDKRIVKQCYDYYNVTNTLFPLTRSCEAASTAEYYKGEEHCGNCLFCFERQAVFGRL